MFAIIETGGKQYRVQTGDVIKVEKLKLEAGDSYDFTDVLAVGKEDDVQWGAPTLPGVSVTAKVIEQAKYKKVLVFRYKAKSNHRKRKGHRQPYTQLVIESINS